jgi:hypothetical protein
MAEDDASKQIEDTIKQEQNSIKELEREMTRNKKKVIATGNRLDYMLKPI